MSYSIKVENLAKCYMINHANDGGARSIREMLAKPFARFNANRTAIESAARIEGKEDASEKKVEQFWALRDVSFEVAEGQRIAIIGGNGAGKSTLLKLLSRITEPTKGRISIRGKVASLLEVGTGFHPELTGRENIFLNGAILGMPRSEIKKKFDSIVAFSGVEKFLDTPVKHYSSGMYVRLAFSVSAWLDPDILIVDEVLSVGDQAFQKRCAERMKELTSDGRTVIFVSHSMSAVKSMCEKALYLNKGEVVSFGPVEDGVADYARTIMDEAELAWHRPEFLYEEGKTEVYVDSQNSTGYARCLSGSLRNASGQTSASLPIDQGFSVQVRYELLRDVGYRVVPNFHFYDANGERFFISFPETSAPNVRGSYVAECKIPPFLFNTGRFTVMPVLSSYEMDTPVHFALPNALRFEITEHALADDRRHGWSGGLPGFSRPRLDWNILPA
jgi:lipopolysaccharide transport system ATP-binding protein